MRRPFKKRANMPVWFVSWFLRHAGWQANGRGGELPGSDNGILARSLGLNHYKGVPSGIRSETLPRNELRTNMKKLSLAFVAIICLSLTGLTGCGGSGETKVIENEGNISGVSEDQQKKMEEEMSKGGGYSSQGSN